MAQNSGMQDRYDEVKAEYEECVVFVGRQHDDGYEWRTFRDDLVILVGLMGTAELDRGSDELSFTTLATSGHMVLLVDENR